MIVKIDTELDQVYVDGEVVFPVKKTVQEKKERTTIADLMEQHIGASEYTGIVADIQKWYYGRVVEASWCCTGLSYFSNLCGTWGQTGKAENCDIMKNYMFRCGAVHKVNTAYKPKRGDVVFMSDKNTYDDITHVGVVSKVNTETGDIVVTSCNCSDSIKKKNDNYITGRYIVAFGEIKY